MNRGNRGNWCGCRYWKCNHVQNPRHPQQLPWCPTGALKTCSCGALCKVPIQHFFFLEVPLIRGNLLCPTTHVYSVLHVCTWTVLVHTVSQNYEYGTLGSIQWITWTKNRWVSCVISTLNLYKKMSRIYSGMLHWLFSQLEFRWVLLRALSVGALQ